MKKFLTLAILSLSSIAFVPSIEAKSSGSTTAETIAVEPQVNVGIGRGNNRFQRRARVTTTTRNIRRGRFLYRETYRTTYRANGRVTTRLLSRTVIRRY